MNLKELSCPVCKKQIEYFDYRKWRNFNSEYVHTESPFFVIDKETKEARLQVEWACLKCNHYGTQLYDLVPIEGGITVHSDSEVVKTAPEPK